MVVSESGQSNVSATLMFHDSPIVNANFFWPPHNEAFSYHCCYVLLLTSFRSSPLFTPVLPIPSPPKFFFFIFFFLAEGSFHCTYFLVQHAPFSCLSVQVIYLEMFSCRFCRCFDRSKGIFLLQQVFFSLFPCFFCFFFRFFLSYKDL